MQKKVANIVTLVILIMTLGNQITISAQNSDREDSAFHLSYVNGSGFLHLLDAELFNSIQLLDFPIVGHSWSPDGTQLAYSSYSAVSNIIILNVETMEESQITFSDTGTLSDAGTYIQNIKPVWSPDGTMIAFISNRDNNWEIYVVVLETMEEYRLTNNDVADGFNGLTWTPNSDGIAFVRAGEIRFNEETQTYEEQHIYLVNPSSFILGIEVEEELVNLTENVNLCPTGEAYYNPSWAIASNQLAFALTCGGGDNTDIHVIDMTSEDSISNPSLINLTHDEIDALALGYYSISWNSSGTRLGFTGIVDDDTPSFEIFILDVKTTNGSNEYSIMQITDSPTDTRFISLSWKSTMISN